MSTIRYLCFYQLPLNKDIPMWSRSVICAVLMLGWSLTVGCSHGPARVVPPAINASSAGAEAIEMFDTNKDGKLSGAELDRCPSLKSAIAQIDKSGQGAITAEMITDRIKAWQQTKTGRMSFQGYVQHNRRPLVGAEVKFVPEKFLGGEIKEAKGVTDKFGRTAISIEPTDPSMRPGLAPGFYRVEITKAGENIPAKYNTATILGQEIAPDAKNIKDGALYDLRY